MTHRTTRGPRPRLGVLAWLFGLAVAFLATLPNPAIAASVDVAIATSTAMPAPVAPDVIAKNFVEPSGIGVAWSANFVDMMNASTAGVMKASNERTRLLQDNFAANVKNGFDDTAIGIRAWSNASPANATMVLANSMTTNNFDAALGIRAWSDDGVMAPSTVANDAAKVANSNLVPDTNGAADVRRFSGP